jgi:hypothetical protein
MASSVNCLVKNSTQDLDKNRVMNLDQMLRSDFEKFSNLMYENEVGSLATDHCKSIVKTIVDQVRSFLILISTLWRS